MLRDIRHASCSFSSLFAVLQLASFWSYCRVQQAMPDKDVPLTAVVGAAAAASAVVGAATGVAACFPFICCSLGLSPLSRDFSCD